MRKVGLEKELDDQPSIQSDAQPDVLSRSSEERVREFVSEIRKLAEADDWETALAHLRRLHPVDQGETLTGLSENVGLQLLDTLGPGETAEIL